MNRQLQLMFIIIFLSKFCVAQDYYADFQRSYNTNDTTLQLEILQRWENEKPKDAELYTCYFNYYFNKSKNEIVILSAGDPPKDKAFFSISDSLGNYAGYIGSKINYDDSNLKKAFDKINRGIELYPKRLDMRFGKIYALGQINDWKSFTNEIIKAIDYSAKNKNRWTWTENKKQQGGEAMFLASIQDYQVQLFNTGNDDLIPLMQEIAKTVLKHYPDHVESLSNLSVGYLILKDYDSALTHLLKAEKLNPQDDIVLSNIAFAYREKKEKENAIKYYEKVARYGNNQAVGFAKREIEKLKSDLNY